MSVFAEAQAAISVEMGGAKAGAGLGLGKPPAEVLFEPTDEVDTRFGFIGLVIFCRWLAFEDVMACRVVQMAVRGGAVAL